MAGLASILCRLADCGSALARRAALLAAVGLSACGGGGKTAGNGVPNVPQGSEPIDSFGADLIAAGCGWSARCNGVATADGCVKGTAGIVSPQILQDVQAGVVKYDPGLGYRCVQLTLDQPCFGPGDLESCRTAFTGTLPAGAACSLNMECASAGCVKTACGADCCPGTCAAGTFSPNLPVGADCSNGICAEGEFCDGTCKARVGEGAACGPSAICQADLDCSGSASPTCVRLGGLGAQCATAFCEMSVAVCNESTLVCSAPPKAGDPCTGIAECGVALDCVAGACVVPGVVGEPCVGADGSVQCQHGYGPYGSVTCTNGVCAQTDPSPAALACASP
jgi:hypothetical protein